MSSTPPATRYYASKKIQWQNTLIIVFLFVITVVYASSLRNHKIGHILALGALVYPLAIVLDFLPRLTKSNYLELSSEGIHMSNLGVIHRTIKWSSIKRVYPVNLRGLGGIAIEYNASYQSHRMGRAIRRHLFTMEEVIFENYGTEGKTLEKLLNEGLSKYSGQVNEKNETHTSSKSDDWLI